MYFKLHCSTARRFIVRKTFPGLDVGGVLFLVKHIKITVLRSVKRNKLL